MLIRNLGEAAAPTAPTPQVMEEAAEYVYSRTLSNGDAFDDLRLTLDSDSEFELQYVVAKWQQSFSVNLRTPRGKPLCSSAVQAENFFGTAQFPRAFLRPAVYAPGAQISFSLINNYAGNNAVEIVFGGIRRYRTQ
jgi:hypothetical protein